MVGGVELRRCTHTTTSGCLMRTVEREELMSLLLELGEGIETPSCVSGSASFILPAPPGLRLRVLARSPRVTAKKRIACRQQAAQLYNDLSVRLNIRHSRVPGT